MNELVGKTDLNELSDEEIVKEILTGKKRLFDLLMRKYNSRMYRIGMSIVNDPTQVEDVMQNAYLKAYENLMHFENRSSFSTWLTRILINESLLQLKEMHRYINMEATRKLVIFEGSNAFNPALTPLRVLVNKELGQALEKALMQLPVKYRLVFVLREIEDTNIVETMVILGLTKANVKVRLNRAKTMLKNTLSCYNHNDGIFPFHLSRCERIIYNVSRKLSIAHES
jgi:RNA polymerase sigma factor (sigma-70 family)